MAKCIEELESEGDIEVLHGEKQVAVNSMVANITKVAQTPQASQEACKAEVEAYKV